jgi:hypothetical protein
MRHLLENHIRSWGGIVHEAGDVLVVMFGSDSAAQRCAEEMSEFCGSLAIQLAVEDEWLLVFSRARLESVRIH